MSSQIQIPNAKLVYEILILIVVAPVCRGSGTGRQFIGQCLMNQATTDIRYVIYCVSAFG